MKVTNCLLKQHLGFHFKKHWRVQAKRKPIDTGAEKILAQKGVKIYSPEDFMIEKKPFERFDVVGFKPKPVIYDESHPDWHARKLLSFKDSNVLVEGLKQAKILTNTVELKNGLPDSIILKDISKSNNERIKRIVLGSHVFDAEQKKLPKVKDPERPAFNFPRIYGITNPRVYNLMVSRLLQFIELNSNESLLKERCLLNDLIFSYPFERSDNLIQFQLRGDSLLTSSKPLSPVTNERTDSIDLPDIYPMKYTITLNEENIYKLETIYPIKSTFAKSHPHTLFIHYDKEEVKNIYEEEVTDHQIYGRSLLKSFTVAASYAKQKFGAGLDGRLKMLELLPATEHPRARRTWPISHQIYGRSLLKSFTVAASYAKQKFGIDAKLLPHPVTIQCVQTDGRLFHFGILQLNTLDLEASNVKNIWYQTDLLPLFEKCGYNVGKPILEGFSNEPVKNLVALYNRS